MSTDVDEPTPGLTVVIPCQQEPMVARCVEAALASARAEGAGNLEILVVGTGDWSRLPPDPAVRAIESAGPIWASAARNRGLGAARAEEVVFLDADCLPLPGWWASIHASQRDQATISSGAIASPDDDTWQAGYNLICFREFLVGLPASPRRFLPSFCLWGPRSAFVAVGGFDENLPSGEDLDLTARLARAGYRLSFEPSARVEHRPAHRSLPRFVRLGWSRGQTSIRARRRYPEAFGRGRWASSPLALVLGAPFAATYLLLRTVRDHPRLARIWWTTIPAALGFRLAWCLGAAWTKAREPTFRCPRSDQ